MESRDEEALSRRERQIMDVIYAMEEATATEVAAGLPDPPTNTAVRTMLRILEQKGHLSHRQEGLKFVYRASRPRARAGRTALERVLRTFFDGSLEKAVAARLGDEAAGMSNEELDRLAELIEQARKKGE